MTAQAANQNTEAAPPSNTEQVFNGHLPLLQPERRLPPEAARPVPRPPSPRHPGDDPARPAQAAGTAGFNETALRSTLQAIAQRAKATRKTSPRPYSRRVGPEREAGHAGRHPDCRRGDKPRIFRDHMVLEENGANRDAIWYLERASGERIMMEARLTAISPEEGEAHLQDLDRSLQSAHLGPHQKRRILVQAWESAALGALEDGLISLDEENALSRYLDHFGLTTRDVIRDVTQGIIPDRGM